MVFKRYSYSPTSTSSSTPYYSWYIKDHKQNELIASVWTEENAKKIVEALNKK